MSKSSVDCKKKYWEIKNVYCKNDVFIDSCKKIKYDASTMTTTNLLAKIDELLSRKAFFKECRTRRKMYTDLCYAKDIDEGHSTHMKLLEAAQKLCDNEIKAIKSVIIFKEKQMKEIKNKFKNL